MRVESQNFTLANAARIQEPRYLVELSFSGKGAAPIQNLLTYSEQFNNSSGWNPGGTPTITANTTKAPDGTTTADTIEDTSATVTQNVSQDVTPDTDLQYTLSLYVRKDSTGRATRFPYIRLVFLGSTSEGANLRFDTSTGEYDLTANIAALADGGVIDASPNYWRVWVTLRSQDALNNNLRSVIYPAGGAAADWTQSAAATGSIVVWGAQLSATEKVIEYNQTEASAETASSNITIANVIKQSEDFSAADWSKSDVTITANTHVAPDGTTTADTLEDVGSAAYGFVYQQPTISGAAFPASIFVRKDSIARTTRFCMLRIRFFGSTDEYNDLRFDTSTGELSTEAAGPDADLAAGVLDIDANWWRIWLSARRIDSGNTTVRIYFYPAAGASATWALSNAVTGSAVVWGAQCAKLNRSRMLPYYKTTDYHRQIVNDRDLMRYYVSSHDDVEFPEGAGGNIIHGAIKSISGQSQQIKPDTARHSIGSITLNLSDKSSRLTELINATLSQGEGLNRKRVRLYKGHESLLSFDDYSLRFTYLVEGITYQDGVYNFRCDDIQRIEKTTIFEPDQGALTKSILADTDEIPITIADGANKFGLVEHDDRYSANPSATVGYVKIDDEIICHSGWTDGTYTALAVVERGALNTRPVPHTITQTQADQKKRVTEYIYLEGPAIKLIYALLTGVLYGQGATLPDNHHLGIDEDFIRRSDFTGIGADLWNPDDNAGRPARFIGEKPTEGKAFIERELLTWLNCFMPVYADGSLGLKRLRNVTPGSAFDVILDEDEIISYGPLRHDMKSLINNMSIKWNWVERVDNFTKTTFLIDSDSISKHGKSKLKEYEFRAVFNGVHSDSDIFNYFSAVRDRYANPPELQQLGVMPEHDRLEVGDTALVQCSQIRDYATGAALNRVFEIQQIKTDWITGAVMLELFGGIEKASESALSASNVMADSYYTTGGTNLTSVLTISGGAVTANGTITGAAKNTSAIYYYDGDLTINAGVTVTITRNAFLRIKGNFTVNGKLLPTGSTSDAGALGSTVSGYSSQFYFGAGNFGYYAKYLPDDPNPGIFPQLPVFNILNPDGLSLEGVPDDIAGRTGAAGTDAFGEGEGIAAGGAGGAGGGGVVIVSRGGSMGASGEIETSGADGSAGSSVLVTLLYRVHGQTGDGGFPGGLLWLIDGNYTFPDFTSENFKAFRGASDPPATIDVYAGPVPQRVSAADEIYGQQIIDTRNYYQAVTRIQYIPPAENGYTWLPEDQRLASQPRRDVGAVLLAGNQRQTGIPGGGPFNVALARKDLLLIAGNNYALSPFYTKINTSQDGKIWTAQSNPGTGGSDDMFGGAVSDDYFVLCGGDTVNTGLVLHSADGVAWSKVTPTGHRSFNDVAFGNGVFVLVGNDDGSDGSLFTATDPATWVQRSNPKAFDLDAVTYSAELDLWIAGGQADGTDAYLITASDPTGTWTERSNPLNRTILGLAAGNGVVVGVGSDGGSNAYIIYSDDGITWTEIDEYPVANELPQRVRFINGVFYAVGSYINSAVGAVLWASENGKDWYQVNNQANINITDIAFDGASFVLTLGTSIQGILITPRVEAE